MKATQKSTILFLCTGNSARSQMAEALLKHKAGDAFDVVSAGTHPEDIDRRTIEAISEFGLNTNGLTSKSVTVFENQEFDYVITLCNKASDECRSYPNAKKQLAWDFPDPKSRPENKPFSMTLNELNSRLSMFLLVEGRGATHSDEESDQSHSIDPITLYKCLTDTIRLKTVMLTHYHGELCVCELMESMDETSQPKVSRNLAVLKKAGVITDRKHGQWVFYRINPELPLWAKSVLSQTTENNIPIIENELRRLANMKNRPDKASFCK